MHHADFLRLFALAAIWGGSYALMRIVAPVFGGIGTMWLRISIAGIVLLAYAVIARKDLAFRRWWRHYLVIGILNSALPFALIAFAMKTLPAGYGAILTAAAPFFGALFAYLLLDERFTSSRLAGLVVGFVGVGLILNLGPVPLTKQVLVAAAALIAATCLYGFVTVYTKKFIGGAPSFGIAVGTLVMSAIATAPIGLAMVPPVWPDVRVVVAMLGLAIFCSSIAYLLYFRLIRDIGPTRTITVTFLIPVFGVLWGALLFDERLNGGAVFGACVVLVGVALVLGILKLPAWKVGPRL